MRRCTATRSLVIRLFAQLAEIAWLDIRIPGGYARRKSFRPMRFGPEFLHLEAVFGEEQFQAFAA